MVREVPFEAVPAASSHAQGAAENKLLAPEMLACRRRRGCQDSGECR
eukprot:CAMPEP_0179348466 /NCGR_PEP_ID=MMETSP0797-20121207/73712_1 /TAXON_ID=47934 /ORGANISM="Dinophysis acuminata, Strain DAEP01" /LENGTH=46 /DNA_ID= /DNA_START= /DNA_END= /DNA_ORIENTATION=